MRLRNRYVAIGAFFAAPVSAQSGGKQVLDIPTATKAVVIIRTFDVNGRAVSSGSGFVVPDGRVVTNRHVLEGARLAEVRYRGRLLASFDYATQLGFSSDIAILPALPSPPGHLALAAGPSKAGDHVYVIGAPLGLENTVSDGIVAALREGEDGRFMQLTAPISPGSSGGPVLNTRGEVVGVAMAQLKEGQNLNFAVLAEDVSALLSSPLAHLSFPAPPTVNRKAATSDAAPVGQRPSIEEAIATESLGWVEHDGFQILSRGCYGDHAKSTIICVLDFNPHTPEAKDVNLRKSVITSTAGGYAWASFASDGTNNFRLAGDKAWLIVRSALRTYLVYYTAYAENMSVQIGINVGGVFRNKDWTYLPTPVVEVDGSKGPLKGLFGYR